MTANEHDYAISRRTLKGPGDPPFSVQPEICRLVGFF